MDDARSCRPPRYGGPAGMLKTGRDRRSVASRPPTRTQIKAAWRKIRGRGSRVNPLAVQASHAAFAIFTLPCGRAARVDRRRRGSRRGPARRLPGLRRRHRLDQRIDGHAYGRSEVARLRRRLRQALRAQSRREDRLDRICPGVAGAHPLQRGGRGHPDGGHQSPEGFRCARRIRQGAGRRRPTGAGQGRADARRYARRSAMGRHVGARHSRRSAGRSRERDAILSRRAEDLAGRAGRAHQHGAVAGAGEAIARGRAGAETGGPRARKPTRGCGEIWRWCWRWKENSARPSVSA